MNVSGFALKRLNNRIKCICGSLQPGAELGGARGATSPPKFCLAFPVAPPKLGLFL